MIRQIDASQFEQEVLSSAKPVLTYFSAPWCGPCKMTQPVVEEVANAYADKIGCVKINVDDSAEIAARYMVMSIPTMIIFNQGEPCSTKSGVSSKSDIIDFITPYL